MTAVHEWFIPASTGPGSEVIPGFKGRFVHGERLTVAHWTAGAGAEVPLHDHPHEQMVNCVQGTFEMRVGDQTFMMGPGDTVVIPGGVPHSALAHTDVYCIDVFHPVREDYRL
jgi:quercetin dioxygenase-like cupin family protein